MRVRSLAGPLLAVTLGLGVVVPTPALGQVHPAAAAASATQPGAPSPEPVAPDSPRAAVQAYFELCRAGEFAEAAAYLDLPESAKAQGPILARRLKEVLDRQIWIKLDDISPRSSGKGNDRLPAGVEEIGAVPGLNGPDPVRLIRRWANNGPRWVFSRATVDHINEWHARLRDRWIDEHMPERLLRPGPEELLWWQWIALPVLFGLALAAGNVLAYLSRLGLRRLVARTKIRLDDALLQRLSGPLTLVWALAAVDLTLPALSLYPPAHAFIQRVLRAGYLVVIFWFATRSIDIGGARLLDTPRTRGNPTARSLVPLGMRGLKLTVFVIAAITVVSELGYPVGSLLTGFGIGGVVLALAAQKTVEHLFGSLSIGIDQPFGVGDYVVVDGLSGTVESIGLRSTRIRTLDRTLVTVPNGKLAEMRIESFTPRDRIKFGCTVALAQGTRPAVVRGVLTGIRAMLAASPKIYPDRSIALSRITDVSIDIEILAWFATTSWDEFLVLREGALLGLLDVVEAAGARLAFPTRTLELASDLAITRATKPNATGPAVATPLPDSSH